MPELPEVETIRTDLQKHIVGQKISRVDIRLPKIIKNDPDFFIKQVVGQKISQIGRIGKLLMIELVDSDFTLLLHLKMTGQLIYQDKKSAVAGGHPWPPIDSGLPNKYSHLIFHFSNGGILFFNDQRQFGLAKIVDANERVVVESRFGLEPLSDKFSRGHFASLLSRRTGPIKGLLLNQQVISGLGNIYADEVCWHAKVKPGRKINTLSAIEIGRLHRACRSVLSEAIVHRGTTFSDYRDANGVAGSYVDMLKVFGRSGKQCSRCGGKIIKTRLVGRGTHYCPNCQL